MIINIDLSIMKKILIVEDDPNTRNAIGRYFSLRGFITQTAENAEQAIATGRRMNPDVLITDWMLGGEQGGNGVEVAECLKKIFPGLQVIFITAFPAHKLREQLHNISAIILEKPLSLATLLETLSGDA